MAAAKNSSVMRIKTKNKLFILNASFFKGRTCKNGTCRSGSNNKSWKNRIVTEKMPDKFIGVGKTQILLKLFGNSLYLVGTNIKRTEFSVGICKFTNGDI